MADKIKGIVVEIGGNTTGLNKALQSTNKEINSTQKELKDIERLLKFDPTNTELLRQKQELLAKSVQETKTKVDALKAAKEKADADMATGTEVNQEQYRKLQREIISTESKLKGLEDQSKSFAKSLGEASKKFESFSKKTLEIGKKASVASAAVTALGVVAFDAAADMQDAIGATDQVFGRQSQAMQEWADNLESYYGIAETEALTYANTMGSMLKNIGGLSETEAAKQSQTLIKLAGDLTAMFGGTTESAVQALTGALKGNNSMLDNYGMAVNEAMIKTKALKMGLIAEGQQLDLAGKQAATLALIMEQTADATGQAQRESEGASGSLRTLKTELKNISAELGDVLLPIITPILQKVSDMIKQFSGLDEKTKRVIVSIGILVAVLGPALMVVGGISNGIGVIIGVIAKLIPLLFGTAETVGLLAKAMTFLAANPIVLIVAAITAFIAIVVHLWNTNEEFKNAIINIWMRIKEMFQSFDIWLQSIFTKDWTESFGAIGNVINAFFKNFSNIWNAMKKIFNGIIDFVKSVFAGEWENAWKALGSIFKGVFDLLAGYAKAPINIVIGYINTLIDGINTTIDKINDLMSKGDDFLSALGFDPIRLSQVEKIPMLAKGTSFHQGGLAIVGEKGPELVNLPRGSQVYPNGMMPGMTTGDIYITIDAKNVNEFNDIIRIAQFELQSQRMGYAGR